MKISQLEILDFGGRIKIQRCGPPREQIVLMYQPIASVYFRSLAASSFLFYFLVESSSTGQYKTHSSLHFILIYTGVDNLARLILLTETKFQCKFFESSVEVDDIQS